MNKKLVFIGCGHMGEALLKGILLKNLVKKGSIVVSDKRAPRRSFIKRKYRVAVTSSNKEAADFGDIIILAIKPQDMKKALGQLKGLISGKLIISIAAGITISYIKKLTSAKKVIRAMPNKPALAECGITAISSSKDAKSSDIRVAKEVFNCVGQIVDISEKDMDAVTAVSGSGPAYIFLLMEAMIDAAVSLGIKRPVAEELVLETTLGSATLSCLLGVHPSELRRKVTSKGGTTEAALKIFKKRGFERTIKQAITAACKRSKQLSM